MNKERRNALSLQRDKLADIMSELEAMRDEEQEYFGNYILDIDAAKWSSAADRAATHREVRHG